MRGVLLVGVSCYIFGVTVYLTGLSPNEFLFDRLLFAVFGLAIAVPLIPILIVAFAIAPAEMLSIMWLGVVGPAIGLVGIGLYRGSIPKSTIRYG